MSRSHHAFIDFEASGLAPGSWPIEAGYCRADGVGAGFLIRPSKDWPCSAWEPKSARIHNISREDLERDGLPPERAMALLNDALDGWQVFSDNPAFDGRWLDLLAQAAGEKPAFTLLDWRFALPMGLRRSIWRDVFNEADRLAPRTHRALPDARNLRVVWTLAWDAAEDAAYS